MEHDILDILKFTIPSVVVLILSVYLIREFLRRDVKLKEAELKLRTRNETVPVRLQAYERLALFIERISLENLLYRLRKPGMSARDLQLALISNIRMEFEHNIAQQVYVSQRSWDAVALCKDEMIRIVNTIASSLDVEAKAEALTKAVLDHVIKSKQLLPTQKAMDTLKEEVTDLF
jgi:hypothetical protein